MEKQKLTIPYIIRNWSSLSVAQKRTILTVLIFSISVLLIVIAIIIGISSCAGAKEARSVSEATTAELPALLRAPQAERIMDPEPIDPEDLTDPEETDDPSEENVETNTPGDTQSGSYTALKKHDKGEDVTELQGRLMELGYLEIEEPTDYFGNSTEYAVLLFQRQHGLKQDGVAGEQTQSLLFSSEAQRYMLLEGAEGRDVKMLQEQLVDLGYLNADDVDSVYGEKTIEAVKEFQKRNGLSADGKAGEKTLERLFGEDAKTSKSLETKQKEESKITPKATSKATSKTTPKPSSKSSSKTTPKTTPKATPKATPKTTPTPKKDSRLDKMIKVAHSKIGCDYILGDKGPNSFDCSGFVYYCLKEAGVSTSRLDANGFSKVRKWKNITSLSEIQKGDLLFFKSDKSDRVSHCGIYIGSGMMIDASSSSGKVVKRSVSTNYWKKYFVNARRPWG